MPRITYKGKTCQEAGCTNQARTRNWCTPHYMNKYRNQAIKCRIDGCSSRWVSKSVGYCKRHAADLTAPVGPVKGIKARNQVWTLDLLKTKTNQNDKGCWLWQGQKIRGYAVIDAVYQGRRTRSGHRLAYRLANGEIEEGMQVHHKCANRSCINPDHLQLVTLESNIAEMHERNKFLKQIGEQAMEISRLREENQALLTLLSQQVSTQTLASK